MITAALSLLLGACLPARPAAAEFIRPSDPGAGGMANCMLIYEQDTRSPEKLLPYVAELDDHQTPQRWFFDSFLFLFYGGSPSGAEYYDGPTNMADWEWTLGQMFGAGRDIPALDEAVARAAAKLGPPPTPRQVVVSIHYPHPDQKAFGDVDGDGQVEDLSDPAQRLQAVEWYVAQVEQRWRELAPRNLSLWGFYWMLEDITADDLEFVRQVADLLHARGHRFLWIPYFNAPGVAQWRESGFDCAVLQPNYAFLGQHKGATRRSRILGTAELASNLGMGVEMECDYDTATNPATQAIFTDYLALGAPEQAGYQQAVKAYYQSAEVFRQLYLSPEPAARKLYHDIARFVAGEPIPSPGPALRRALVGGQSEAALSDGLLTTHLHPDRDRVALAGQPCEVVIELAEAAPVPEIELSIPAGGAAWQGRASTEVPGPDGRWQPGGWAALSVPPSPGPQTVVVPVGAAMATRVRLILEPAAGVEQEPLRCDEVRVFGLGTYAGEPGGDLAAGLPYTLEPPQAAQYPDNGGELTDGVVATDGFLGGKTVGWMRGPTVVLLDLGAARPVSRVVVHADGGGQSAVRFPLSVTAEGYEVQPTAWGRTAGLGQAPPAPRWVAAVHEPVVDLVRAEAGDHSDLSGHFDLVGNAERPVRFISLCFDHDAWLMLSEIEAFAGDENVARGTPYWFRPAPTPAQGGRYADDGVKLTDGVAAQEFDEDALVGRMDGVPLSVTLDLGAQRSMTEAGVWALGGGLYAMWLPKQLTAWAQVDGDWRRIGTATPAVEQPGDRAVAEYLHVQLAQPVATSRVRLDVEPDRGWLMLSEVVVRER